jgi:hypothetical protein
VIPARECVRLALAEELHALALLAVTDHVEVRLGQSGEELEVLAEAEIVDRGARCERDAIELDHAADARAASDMTGILVDPVGEVEHRVGSTGQLLTLIDAERRTDEALLAEGGSGGAERPGDDEQVARYGARAARDPVRRAVTERTSLSALVVSPPTIGTFASPRPP